MQFVILIHSNPQPWGHPTSDFTADYQALPQPEKDRLGAHFDEVMATVEERGEILFARACGDPREGVVLRHGAPDSSEPYDAEENLAGFFVVEVESRERALEIARAFSCPGDTVELRTLWEG